MSINNLKLQGMIFGAFYGDAYSLGGHWVYDTIEIENACFDLSNCNNPISPYHPTKSKGDFTHYGDQMFWLLQDLVKEDKFSLVDFGQRWHTNMQIYTGYIDGASKHTVKKLSEEKNYFACGSSSSDLSAVSRMFPIILKYNDSLLDMQEAIKLHTILTHMNKDLVLSGAFFCEVSVAVLNGADLEKTILESSKHFGDNILQWTQKAQEALEINPKEAIHKLGASCSVNGAFASTIYILLKYKDNFFEALKENMLAGGESSARGMIIGGILGIVHAKELLSSPCIQQMNQYEEIKESISHIL